MVGVSGKLVGRIRKRYSDRFGRWRGINLVGKDGREILVVSIYNVSQKVDAGIGPNKLYKDQQSQYMNQCHNLKRKSKHNNISHTNYMNPQYQFYSGITTFLAK